MSETAPVEYKDPALAASFMRPTNIADAVTVAELLANSDFVPKDYKGKPGNIIACMQFSAELNLPVMQGLQNIAVINGHPSIYGDLALALVERSGLLEAIDELVDEKGATCTVKRKGRNAITRHFTQADAKQANLWDKAGPWKQYPKRMLQMRARGFCLRDAFPDVLKGIAIREEVQDYQEIDITPAPAAADNRELLDSLKASASKQKCVEDLELWWKEMEDDINDLSKDERLDLIDHCTTHKGTLKEADA